MSNDQIQIARDLTAIVSMYHRLSLEAVYKFADKENPGGDALLMSLPAANLREWEAIYDEAEATDYRTEGERKKATDYVQDQTGELHPLLVLATWEDALRDELGVPTRERATVAKSAGYIRSAIPWMFDTNEFGDVNFIAVDQLMDDLGRCRSMLENLLKDGEREDTGVPCMECGSALVKVRHRYPRSVPMSSRTDFPDTWKCGRCKEVSTHEQYKLAVRNDYLRSADRLNATDMLEQYRIKPGSLTGWATKGLVKKRGKDDSGRQLYDVKDALKQRDGDDREDVA